MAVQRRQPQVTGLSLAVIFSALAITVLAQDNQNCRPPSIERGWQSRRDYYFYPGESVEIPCVATGEGTFLYQWTKNGEPVAISAVHGHREIFMKPGVGTLVIGSSNEEDLGYYQCRVSNECGVALSDKTRLILGQMEPFPVQHIPEVVRTVVGDSVVLSCVPPYSVPPPYITWALQGPDDLYHGFQEVEWSDRITTSYTGNLYITNVHAGDEQQGRVYVCIATNPILRFSNIGEDTQIHVLQGWYSGGKISIGGAVIVTTQKATGPNVGGAGRDQPVISTSGPLTVKRGSNQIHETAMMWHSDTDITVLKGGRAEMKCIFSGNPLPTVNWTRENDQFDQSRAIEDHHELTIRDVEASDGGQYTCTGQNGLGAGPVTHTFTLTVEASPEWQSEPVDTTAAPGASAEFECSAEGDPEPTVEWFINGQPIQDAPSDSRRTLTGSTLHFSDLVLSDSQVIQCNASNIHGYLWAGAYLFVQGTDAGDEVVV